MMEKKILFLALAIMVVTGCAHQDDSKDNYKVNNSDVANSESDSSSDKKTENDNSAETDSSNEDDSNGTIVNETSKYTYIAHGDEYCTVVLRDTGEKLCTITKDKYEQDFLEGKVEEYDDILGYEGFVVSVPFWDYNLVEVYCNTDSGYQRIEQTVVRDYFVEDIDGNNVSELILDVIFMGDGGGEVFVDRNYNNTFQSARVRKENTDLIQYGSIYDSKTKTISIIYGVPTDDHFDEETIPMAEAYQDKNILKFEDIDL